MTCDQHCGHIIALGISGGCVLLTIIISFFQVGKHLKHYTNAHFQKKIIIIIFMAPFYALTSCSTIATQDTTGYFNLVRDIYESVLIYAFFHLLAMYIAYDAEKGEVDYNRIYEALETKGVRQHLFPMNYIFKPMILISRIRAEWHFRQSRLYILQYLAIKPFCSFCLIIVDLIDADSPVGWFFQAVVFISVILSVYYLVLFYQILHAELAPAKPLLKFLSVKGVLFFTFWQDFVVEIVIDKVSNADAATKLFVITDIENMLVCIEMVILTIMTTIAFSYKDFRELQKKGFQQREGAITLARKLVDDVFTDGFVTAVKDLKELKEPLKDPFKKYRDANIEQTDLMTLSGKLDKGLLDEEELSGAHVNMIERPVIIPGFIKDNRVYYTAPGNTNENKDPDRDFESVGYSGTTGNVRFGGVYNSIEDL